MGRHVDSTPAARWPPPAGKTARWRFQMPDRIFIDRPLPARLRRALRPRRGRSSAPTRAELPTCRAAIAGASLWPAERIAKRRPMLEVISRSGIGFDTVDLDAAAAAGCRGVQHAGRAVDLHRGAHDEPADGGRQVHREQRRPAPSRAARTSTPPTRVSSSAGHRRRCRARAHRQPGRAHVCGDGHAGDRL